MNIPYNQTHLKHKYYGRNLELLVLKATVAPTEGERKAFISYLVKLMQNFYLQWNKDTIEVDACLTQILQMSGFKLQAEVDALRKDGIIMEANPKDGNRVPNKFNNAKTPNSSFGGNGGRRHKGKSNNNRNRYNSNKKRRN